ncbi:MAG: hypothetical protein Q9Q13_02560 [Acidobacteriota bacterium]|nr:hypothetical protein [Acidobacteriota bacterium]
MQKTSQALRRPAAGENRRRDGRRSRPTSRVVALRSVDTDDFMTADWSRACPTISSPRVAARHRR